MQVGASRSLPAPDGESAAHSARVAAFIRERIAAAGGSLSFAEFMHLALYAPGLGYYTSGTTKFGEGGDFVTAPEISPLFGRVIAGQVAPVLGAIGDGSILELGAGSGRLAVDVLSRLEELDALPARYLILDVGGDLVDRQARLIHEHVPALAGRVEWLDALPREHRGVIVANEVLDALPVERFVRRDEPLQVRVCAEGDRFLAVEAPAPARVAEAVRAIEGDIGRRLDDGYASELSPACADWTRSVVESLACGIVLLFDYGLSRREYYAPDRRGGWLRCHFRHHAHDDPLIYPGIQDITAWVDFSAVADAAVYAGARIAGYVNQALFLAAGGLDAEFRAFDGESELRRMQLSAGIKTLTLPGEMGERFKVMALVKGDIETPAAFGIADRTHTL